MSGELHYTSYAWPEPYTKCGIRLTEDDVVSVTRWQSTTCNRCLEQRDE